MKALVEDFLEAALGRTKRQAGEVMWRSLKQR
jgi:hypothetical protein